jgi:hypothetical protein
MTRSPVSAAQDAFESAPRVWTTNGGHLILLHRLDDTRVATLEASRILLTQREKPMPLPPRDFSTVGPNEGERFPDVLLPDQTGAAVDLHGARAGRKAIVVFHRSAEW